MLNDGILTDPYAIKTKHLYDFALWVVGISAAIICVILMYCERGDIGIIVFFIMVVLALIIGAVGIKKALKMQYKAEEISKPVLSEKSKKRNKFLYGIVLIYIVTLICMAVYML